MEVPKPMQNDAVNERDMFAIFVWRIVSREMSGFPSIGPMRE